MLRRTGHYVDQQGKKRIKYGKVETWSGKGNVFAFEQGPVKGGGMQYSFAKFVTVSQRSEGWQQKPIVGVPIENRLQKEVDRTLQTDQRLQKAIVEDAEVFLTKYFDR